jgi:hypothetical protein
MTRRSRRGLLWRKQQQCRIALNVAFSHGHIKNLAEIPAEVIDDRKREPDRFAFSSSRS